MSKGRKQKIKIIIGSACFSYLYLVLIFECEFKFVWHWRGPPFVAETFAFSNVYVLYDINI